MPTKVKFCGHWLAKTGAFKELKEASCFFERSSRLFALLPSAIAICTVISNHFDMSLRKCSRLSNSQTCLLECSCAIGSKPL